MKKLIVVVLVVATVVACLSGCGNENWGFGNYTYTHAHITDGAEAHCVTVNSWHDNEVGCEIHTPNGGAFLSEGTYQLFENAKACPYC